MEEKDENEIEQNNNNEQQQKAIDKNERQNKITFIISILALAISVIQFIFSNPYFLRNFTHPKILVKEYIYKAKKSLLLTYDIENISKNPAISVIVDIRAFKNDQIFITPKSTFELFKTDTSSFLYNYSYKADVLSPGEKISLIIISDTSKIIKPLNKRLKMPNLMPLMIRLKSNEGITEIERDIYPQNE